MVAALVALAAIAGCGRLRFDPAEPSDSGAARDASREESDSRVGRRSDAANVPADGLLPQASLALGFGTPEGPLAP